MGMMHLLGLHSLSKIGSVRLRTLVNAFGDYETVWDNFDMWQEILGQNLDYAEIRRERNKLDLTALYEQFLTSDAKLVTIDDPEYPRLLANIPEPPYVLFYKGELPKNDENTVAVIGSRKATAYGREAAAFFATELAKADVWIVSGMARGIDSVAHQAALDAGGRTVGVLGCGIDMVYPPENGKLHAETARHGCLISEYPIGMHPLSRNFPMRNRVISGLSRAVLVVEAGEHSGTQITVNYATAQNRHIYAVPGSIFSNSSAGTLALIRDGKATLAASAEDIMRDFDEEYQYVPTSKAAKAGKAAVHNPEQQLSFAMPKLKPLPKDPKESRVVEFVTEQKHFNDIARFLGEPTAEVATMMTLLELAGYVKRLDGQYYIRSQV